MNEIIAKIRLRLQTDKKMLLILICGMVGIMLLAFSSTSSQKKDKTDYENASVTEIRMIKDAEALLRTVDGVGKVKVYLTIESLEKNEYAINTDETEKDDSKQKKDEYVLVDRGNENGGLLIRNCQPTVRGVAVSCEGGGSSIVRNEVIKLMCAAFGIGSNKVWVSKMKNG